MSEYIISQGSSDERRLTIDKNRRLLPVGVLANSSFEEYYDLQFHSRVIAMPAGGHDARLHEELYEARMPVLSGMYTDEELLLVVPEGSRPVRKLLRLIARDLPSYEGIFHGIGMALGRLHSHGFGVPVPHEERGVLDNFALSLSGGGPSGGRLHLIPPYDLDPGYPADQQVNAVFNELERTEFFDEPSAMRLIDRMVSGWQEEMYSQAGQAQDA